VYLGLVEFADDINIQLRDQRKTSFVALETAADAIGLKVNEGKSKFVAVRGNKKKIYVESYIEIMD